MAFLRKNVLGKPTGKVGDMVFRYYNGEVILTSHSGKNKISNSAACVNNRANFSTVLRFASVVNSIPQLKQIWNESKYNGNKAYSKIISANTKKTIGKSLSENNIITPDGVLLKISSWSFNKKSVSVNFTLPGNSNNYRSRKFTACFILALSNPVTKSLKPVEFFGTTEENFSLPVNESASVTKSFSKQQNDAIKQYKNVRVYFALADVSGKKPVFSCSYSQEFNIS